jgi:hypothetical protein
MRFFKLLAGIAALASVSAALPAVAGTNYDGNWSVALQTERGTCQAASWSLAVSGGRIEDSGLFVQSAGYIDGRGHVVLRVTHGSDTLAANGRVEGARASGTWQSPTQQCSGRWFATRS